MTKTLKMFLLIYSPLTLFHIVPTFNDLENRNVLKMLWEKKRANAGNPCMDLYTNT